MSGSPFSPAEIPASAWQHEDLQRALSARDVPELLRLVQRHSGLSQSRMAVAMGMGQGRVNEIINGRRGVNTIEVFERIANGLKMPDQARMLIGLAPANAAVRRAFAGHAEIAQVFTSQADAEAELLAHAGHATELDLLAVRALGLIGLNDSLLRPPLSRRSSPVRMRVLLLDPESPAAAARAAEIGESANALTSGIRLCI